MNTATAVNRQMITIKILHVELEEYQYRMSTTDIFLFEVM